MSSASRVLAVAAFIAAVAALVGIASRPAHRLARAGEGDLLRVCADPNNLPFSNDRGEGFENQLAELAAADLGRRVAYTWWPQRRGFIRTTLRAGVCDVVMGVPASFELALTTNPYYRSTYVFVTRADRLPGLASLDDARLVESSIGVHLVGDDYASVPPAQELAKRGLITNIRGYSIYGDYSQPNPPARLIEAVADAEVDLALAWGPLAGFFAAHASPPLAIAPIAAVSGTPFAFEIAMGVRRDDPTLQQALNGVIARRADDIRALLAQFHVPTLPAPPVVQGARSDP